MGAPGIGKSSLLANLAQRLQDTGAAVVLLCAGELAARSIGELQAELDLEHQIKKVLPCVPGKRPAFLLIDALDATRGDSGKATAIRQLIQHARSLSEDWHVIASIRRFDLLWSTNWRRLFRASVSKKGELGDVSHLEVGLLDDSELAQLAVATPDLGALITHAPPLLRELLRVPFHLRLAVELGLDATSLAQVTTQLDLLDRYWLERIEGGVGGEARVAAMAAISRCAIDERTTRIRRSITTNPGVIEELEHVGVLLRNGDHLEVAHHVVLDYAISRSAFSSDGASLGRLAEPDVAIFYRQSVVMWLERLWAVDRPKFWRLLFAATELRAPCVTRIAVSDVLVRKVATAADLQPLLHHLSEQRIGVGTQVFQFLHGTIVGVASTTEFGPWLAFFELLANSGSDDALIQAARLVDTLSREKRIPSALEPQAASAARALLIAAWRGTRSQNLVVWATRCVVRTFSADAEPSARLLACAFSDQPPAHSVEVVGYLTENIDGLFDAPELVRDVYVFALEREASAAASRLRLEPKDMRTGEAEISGDWASRAWKLREELGDFFDRSPVEATMAVARATRACEPYRPQKGKPRINIELNGIQIEVDDLPQDMDQISRSLGELHEVVERYCGKLISLAAEDMPAARALVDRLIAERATAAVWATLLDAATGNGAALQLVEPLTHEPSALRLFASYAASLLRSVRAQLIPAQTTRIIDAIEQIPKDGIGLDARERLRAALVERDEPPHTHTRAEIVREGIGEILLAERGMSAEEIKAPKNVEVQQLEERAVEAGGRLASDLSLEAVHDAHSALDALVVALGTPDVHEAQQRSAWGTAAQLATALATQGSRSALPVLLAAATKPEPLPNPKQDDQFAQSPGWGTGFARIEAAQGLAVHVSKWNDNAALDALEDLANDHSAVVRYQVARNLRPLMMRAPDTAWALVEQFASDDNATVAEAALHSFGAFFFTGRERAVQFVLQALQRSRGDRPGFQRVIARCWRILVEVHVVHGESSVTAVLDDLIANVERHAESISNAMQSIRPLLRTDESEVKTRRRAGALLRQIVEQAVSKVRSQGETDEMLNAPLRENRTPLARLISSISHQIYFASGAHESDHEEVPTEQRLQVLNELRDVMALLGQSGIVEASDHILDTLDEYVRGVVGTDVEALLPMFLAIARSATEHGYQFGWRGFDVIDQTVRWYLAERPDLLQVSANLQTLSSIVDAFVDAGWPAAFRLARDLGQSR